MRVLSSDMGNCSCCSEQVLTEASLSDEQAIVRQPARLPLLDLSGAAVRLPRSMHARAARSVGILLHRMYSFLDGSSRRAFRMAHLTWLEGMTEQRLIGSGEIH